MGERAIIHINVADFAVAVERVVDRRLRGRPVIVATAGSARASVYDMSEEAYASGVRKGMRLGRALGRCRDAAVLPPHPDRYQRAMAALLGQARRYSPRVEMADAQGHLFVDATGTGRLLGPPPDVAVRIRRAVHDALGVVPVWALATNRLVAKVATRVVKPDGEHIVRPGDEASFLSPLPLFLIPGLAAETLRRLGEFNLVRTGQVAALTPAQLSVIVDRAARKLHDAVRGIDPSPVLPAGKGAPLVRLAHLFGEDTNHAVAVTAAVRGLAQRAGADLRRRHLRARRAAVVIDYADGGRIVRQAAIRPPSFTDADLFAAARTALDRAWVRRVRIRRLELTFDRLTASPVQLPLFPVERRAARRQACLDRTVDGIRARFGPDALKVGAPPAAVPYLDIGN